MINGTMINSRMINSRMIDSRMIGTIMISSRMIGMGKCAGVRFPDAIAPKPCCGDRGRQKQTDIVKQEAVRIVVPGIWIVVEMGDHIDDE